MVNVMHVQLNETARGCSESEKWCKCFVADDSERIGGRGDRVSRWVENNPIQVVCLRAGLTNKPAHNDNSHKLKC